MNTTRRAGLACLLAAACVPWLQAQPQHVGLLVVPLDGPQPLGQKAATVLNLQVWQTLRAAPSNNVHGLSFGKGVVYWDEGKPLSTHAEAAERGRSIPAHLVLWGKAQPFGRSVVVQAYLTVVNPRASDSPGTEFWRLHLPELGEGGTLAVDIPAWTYEFAPIVLRREVVPELNTPEGIPIYKDRSFQTKVGTLGAELRALEQGADMAKVVSGGVQGWVRLPNLGVNRSEVTDFAGGLIRVFRKDRGGAIDLMRRVIANQRTPVSIKIWSYLLMAACSRLLYEQIGAPDQSLEHIAAAEQLNPYLQQTVRYKCMALLAQRHRLPGARQRLEATVKGSEYLFPPNDPWLDKVKKAVRRLQVSL